MLSPEKIVGQKLFCDEENYFDCLLAKKYAVVSTPTAISWTSHRGGLDYWVNLKGSMQTELQYKILRQVKSKIKPA